MARNSNNNSNTTGAKGMKQFILFSLSGAIGTGLFYLFHTWFLALLGPDFPRQATVAWLVSYFASIWWQHALHQLLVFGSTGDGYLKSLLLTYAAYSISIGLSPVITDLLVYTAGLDAQTAWVITLVSTGVLNYLTVSKAFEEPKQAQD